MRCLPSRLEQPRLIALGGIAVATWLFLVNGPFDLSAQCGPNPIVCENQLPGNAPSEWDISGAGEPTLQGFATDISVNTGETVHFKVDTTVSAFRIDIYRLGYYGGLGARKVASLGTFAGQQQVGCVTSAATGLVDCGNWLESAAWLVPTNAVSGVYLARLRRTDTGGASHIVFVVRDDAAQADVLFQTSDTTWQAYNQYGGNSLYVGGPGTNPGRAYKVSYNRPFTTRGTSPADWLFNAEYPMIRWLEANGFNVSYITGLDTDRIGATELERHRVFLSVGHDEYWSGAQRANAEAARNAGVNLAFFSGNEVFWKTRWEASIDGSNTPYRTLVSYKETHANAVIDPADPAIWTGSWRDPRFSPPADGGRPENALTGTIFTVNCCTATAAITVSQAFASQPFWRYTRVATLPAGGSTTLTAGTLGYEWDENLNNGFRPVGLTPLSATTLSASQKLQDYGSTYASGTATHALTLYRHPSGALVFGAGTVQWSWGLDGTHDRGGSTPDLAMQQATVNLLADMSVAPGSLQPGLISDADTTPPTVAVTAPGAGATVAGTAVAVTATASDNVSIANVQFKLDGINLGGQDLTPPYTATWNTTTASDGNHTLTAVARDLAGNTTTATAVVVTVANTGATCPCSLWPGSATPGFIETTDTSAVELGMRFRADAGGTISAVRFYKDATATGTHVGHLWTNAGTLLGTVTFTETASGWQQASFAAPVAISANTTYVVSYFAPAGRYAADGNYFAAGRDKAPLHAPADGVAGANGVYRYGASGFPSDTYQASNYWVDVVFATTAPPPDTTPPAVALTAPGAGATVAGTAAAVTASASDNIGVAGVQFRLDGINLGSEVLSAPYATTWNTTTASNGSHTLTAVARDAAGNTATAASVVVTVANASGATCPCSLWPASAAPGFIESTDTSAVELGMRFRADADGNISAVRFYKSAAATGTHVGHLWSNTGTLLGTVTFTETASGWQQATFSAPIAIAANTTYVVSYYAPAGRYAADNNYFASARDNAPLHAPADGVGGANGVYRYGSSGFPASTYQATNYWVDVVFATTTPPPPDTTPPTVALSAPGAGATVAGTAVAVTATAADNIGVAGVQFKLDGINLGSEVLGAPYATTWNTTTASNGSHTLTAVARDAAGNTTTATAVVVTVANASGATCPCSLWPTSAMPGFIEAADTSAVELGMRFRADTDGNISAVRFYKGATATGTHVGHLWTNTGTLLGTVTFTETASGWQQATFATPIAISANTTYVVSYFAPAGRYAADNNYFNTARDNAPLHAPADGGAGANGVYRYGASGFPTNTYQASNYWVDVVFTPTPP